MYRGHLGESSFAFDVVMCFLFLLLLLLFTFAVVGCCFSLWLPYIVLSLSVFGCWCYFWFDCFLCLFVSRNEPVLACVFLIDVVALVLILFVGVLAVAVSMIVCFDCI